MFPAFIKSAFGYGYSVNYFENYSKVLQFVPKITSVIKSQQFDSNNELVIAVKKFCKKNIKNDLKLYEYPEKQFLINGSTNIY